MEGLPEKLEEEFLVGFDVDRERFVQEAEKILQNVGYYAQMGIMLSKEAIADSYKKLKDACMID